jgi:oligoribonuclease (3'-5' exoribonuclease)
MRPYVSIDIETTGLNEDTCQVLSIGAVIDDWTTPIEELPQYHCYLDNGPIIGTAYALSMHPKILRAIATCKYYTKDGIAILEPNKVAVDFKGWLARYSFSFSNTEITPAGKNFDGFDRQFLKRLPNWNVRMKHRSIDPGNLYYDPSIDDGPPSTEVCMKRAGIEGGVAHTALDDALMVVRLIRYWADHRHMMPTHVWVPTGEPIVIKRGGPCGPST